MRHAIDVMRLSHPEQCHGCGEQHLDVWRISAALYPAIAIKLCRPCRNDMVLRLKETERVPA